MKETTCMNWVIKLYLDKNAPVKSTCWLYSQVTIYDFVARMQELKFFLSARLSSWLITTLGKNRQGIPCAKTSE